MSTTPLSSPFHAELIRDMSALSLQTVQNDERKVTESIERKRRLNEIIQDISGFIQANAQEHSEAARLFPNFEKLKETCREKLAFLEASPVQEPQRVITEEELEQVHKRYRRNIRVFAVWKELSSTLSSPIPLGTLSPDDPHFWLPFAERPLGSPSVSTDSTIIVQSLSRITKAKRLSQETQEKLQQVDKVIQQISKHQGALLLSKPLPLQNSEQEQTFYAKMIDTDFFSDSSQTPLATIDTLSNQYLNEVEENRKQMCEWARDLSGRITRKELIPLLQYLQGDVDDVYNYFPQTPRPWLRSLLPLETFTEHVQEWFKRTRDFSPFNHPETFLREFQTIQTNIQFEHWAFSYFRAMIRLSRHFSESRFPSNVHNLTEWVLLLRLFVQDEAYLERSNTYRKLQDELIGIKDLFNNARTIQQTVNTIKEQYKSTIPEPIEDRFLDGIVFEAIQAICPLPPFLLTKAQSTTASFQKSDLCSFFISLQSPLCRPFIEHIEKWLASVNSNTPQILAHIQNTLIVCDPASREIQPSFLQVLEQIGLKLSQESIQRAERDHSTIEQLLQDIARHNKFGSPAEGVKASRFYKICQVYEQVASPLRTQWEQSVPLHQHWIRIVSQRGLIHFYPFIPIQGEKREEGGAKAVTSANCYKPNLREGKEKIAVAQPLYRDDAPLIQKEADISSYLKRQNISGFIRAKVGTLFSPQEEMIRFSLPYRCDTSKKMRELLPAHCLVMKRASGGSLTKYLDTNRSSLPPQTLLLLSLDIAKEIANFHRAGYIYNDLKPDNILIFEKEGQRPTATIGDLATIRKRGYLSSILSTLITPEQYDQLVDYLPVESSQEAEMFALGEVFAIMCGLRSPMKTYRLAYDFLKEEHAIPDEGHDPDVHTVDIIKNRYKRFQIPFQDPEMKNSPNPLKRILGNLFLLDPRARWTAEQLVQYLSQQIAQAPPSSNGAQIAQ